MPRHGSVGRPSNVTRDDLSDLLPHHDLGHIEHRHGNEYQVFVKNLDTGVTKELLAGTRYYYKNCEITVKVTPHD